MRKFNALDWVALVLLIIGGINWGLIGLFEFDLVAAIFGTMSAASRVVYTLVGLSAVYIAVISPTLAHHFKERPATVSADRTVHQAR